MNITGYMYTYIKELKHYLNYLSAFAFTLYIIKVKISEFGKIHKHHIFPIKNKHNIFLYYY